MKKILFILLTILSAYNFGAAQQVITGTVSDEREPLIGATVQVKGTGRGVATDFDGMYSIQVPNGETVLIFSYIGLESQEILVGDQTSINVILKENTSVLDEVVVVGYGTQKRSKIAIWRHYGKRRIGTCARIFIYVFDRKIQNRRNTLF